MLTSTPEVAVGLTSVASGTPSIFVGNLLGGIPIIFLLIVPILSIFGRGIKLSHNLNQGSIFLAIAISLAPFVVVLDHNVTNTEALLLIVGYLTVMYLLYRNNTSNKYNMSLLKVKSYSFLDILKVLIGTGLVLFSSNLIVSSTLYFSQTYNIAPFYISLIVLSLGTNLPELTMALRAIISGKKDIAFGDYLGSASANAFLFGLFTLMSKDKVLQVDNFSIMFIIVAVGLGLFYQFSRSKRSISPKEGFILLSLYLLFIVIEFLVH
jgi:cation:H+ antiporter